MLPPGDISQAAHVSAVKTVLCKSAKASSEDQIQARNHLTPHFHFLIGTLTSCKEIRKVTIIKISSSLNAHTHAHTSAQHLSSVLLPHQSARPCWGRLMPLFVMPTTDMRPVCPLDVTSLLAENGSSQLAVSLPLLPPAVWTHAKQEYPAARFKPACRRCERQLLRHRFRTREINSQTAEVTWHAFLRTDNCPARCSCLILSHFFFFTPLLFSKFPANFMAWRRKAAPKRFCLEQTVFTLGARRFVFGAGEVGHVYADCDAMQF